VSGPLSNECPPTTLAGTSTLLYKVASNDLPSRNQNFTLNHSTPKLYNTAIMSALESIKQVRGAADRLLSKDSIESCNAHFFVIPIILNGH
jgi:hypothetical protein